MKYGIKHDTGKIEALTKFPDDIVPGGFVELTETKYNDFKGKLDVHPFYTYNDGTNELDVDITALGDAQTQQDKNALRAELLELSNELDLKTRMGEDTTATQTDFDNKKAAYNAL